MDNLEWYVGLSGILHSMLVFGSIAGLIHKRKEFILLLTFVLIKILFEQFYGTFSGSMLDEDVIVNAHMYGATTGLILGIVLFIWKKGQSKKLD